MTNLVKIGHLQKANLIKPIQNFNHVMGNLKLTGVELINELPNTHQCANCGEQVNLKDYHTKYGNRYCSITCQEVAEKNYQGNESQINWR